ncbi:MAG: DUF2336 domain-containing protein [Rhodospirillales bacterium]|nr:DUF2336 domain-containing protein [Alphaproteobacteria bacterium]USO05811.1 MAG: DUF2336 domain-containing protein [Rhodospirillales bacterium]
MIFMFSKFFGKTPKSYEQQRAALASANVKERLSLASNTKTNKEILYYLAEKDPSPKVRKAVAENEAMPVQVSSILAGDSDSDVRLALAGRLVDLLPDVSQDQQSQLYAFVVQALGTLALDEVLKIRVALSSTLKDHAHTPPKIAGQLARDVEQQVSEPILRFCSALSNADLLDILKSHPASWVIEAIASRDSVSEELSEAVVETRDSYGGSALIGNDGALISDNLLHRIVEIARTLPEWQKPMAVRKSLSVSIARDLAEFVDASVRDLLLKRGDFDENTTEELAAVFRRRVDFVDDGADETPRDKLARLIQEGGLNEETISDALAMREKEFVAEAIAYLGKTTASQVQKVFDMGAAKPIVALAWHAGLSMRLALALQKEAGRVNPKEILYPKGGTDYPLSEEDLNWQLEFLGLK